MNPRIIGWVGTTVIGLAAATAALAKKPLKAHEHGAATLNVAVEGTAVLIGLEAPGDDVFGFEHAPRTDAETKAVADALATLRGKTAELFQLPKDADCQVSEAKVTAAQETAPKASGKNPAKAPAADEHSDVDADFAFTCKATPAGGALKLGLFKAFPRIKKLKVQVISGAKQTGSTVQSDQDQVKL